MTGKRRSFIGKYEIIRVLGRGGMGTVYLCRDSSMGRDVAVKVLNYRNAIQQATVQKLRFLREAMATARLQHPGIPPVYHVDETKEGKPYYAMKPIEGESLEAILDRLKKDDPRAKKNFDLFRLVDILREVCQALHYAHTRGFIHRDLKPSNIFVGNYGEVYIIDWGLTKVLKDGKNEPNEKPKRAKKAKQTKDSDDIVFMDTVSTSDSTISQSGQHGDIDNPNMEDIESRNTLTLDGDVLGTLAYMPPEQAAGEVETVGKEVDIYALGVILYEILTLHLPVDSGNFQSVLRKKQHGKIVPPESRTPFREIPPELSATTMQAMSPQPEERFKSAADFDNALSFWLEGKTQFRNSYQRTTDKHDYVLLPRNTSAGWKLSSDAISTKHIPPESPSYLLFEKEFAGDIRLSMNVIAEPSGSEGTISEFAVVLNANIPKPWPGYLDCYSIHLGAAGNTRAYLCKNDSEVASNEYIVLEPRRRYRLQIERTEEEIRVMLNRQIILFYSERDPLPGMQIGFMHHGEGITFSGIRVQTRGLPTMTSSLKIPEALMEEGCYKGAYKRFLTIAQAHKNRQEGAWARYRAGIASYNIDKDRKRAFKIWAPLRRTHYAIYEQLGLARLELDNDRPQKAAIIISNILDNPGSHPHLDPIADLVFGQAQQLLRNKPNSTKEWKTLDMWARHAIQLGQMVESKKSMTPSILWRWILLALTEYPKQLPECIKFLGETVGRGKGSFAEILTTINPLMQILTRSAEMTDHAFLVDKVMRLILCHDDNLGNLETLARFYLHSGHEGVAQAISHHIFWLCRKYDYEIPAMPITFVAFVEWLKGDKQKARELFETMIEDSMEWARLDGYILLGMDHYFSQEKEEAEQCWREMLDDSEAVYYNRHFIGQGLLGELPPNPVEAGVPNRSDHRLLYCLFMGYKNYADWLQNSDEKARDTAVKLLTKVLQLLRPSYDIYSATDTFARIPLEAMGFPVPVRKAAQPISKEEEEWLKDLTYAASHETSAGKPRTSSNHVKRSRSKKKSKKPRKKT